MRVDAVFFDSGHTLMRPLGNRWFPGLRFFELCSQHGLRIPDDALLAAAVDAGQAYLEANHAVPDEAAERRQFAEFCRIIIEYTGRHPSRELLTALADSAVGDVNFEPYAEARSVLDLLADMEIPMAVLTDAWPSVRTKFRTLGFLAYFDAFVISAEERCTKPDMGMFRPALTALDVEVPRTLFVDDSPKIVDAARDLGFQVLLMDHDGQHIEHPDRISTLHGVVAYVTERNAP